MPRDQHFGTPEILLATPPIPIIGFEMSLLTLDDATQIMETLKSFMISKPPRPEFHLRMRGA